MLDNPDEQFGASPADSLSRSEQVCKMIIASILRGDLAENRKLPTEVALASQYAVSRTTIREALSRLRSEGIVVSRRGSGNYVQRVPAHQVPARAHLESIHDVERYYAFRQCVEVGAAQIAAQARNDTDLAAMHAAYLALHKAQLEGATGVDEDLALHMAIANASHNPFFISTIQFALGPIRQCMELAQNLGRAQDPAHIMVVHGEHHAIVQAITEGSPSRAGEAMRAHIENARLRIFEG